MTEYYVGLMSGTSADGIDAVLVAIDDKGSTQLIASLHQAYPSEVRNEIDLLRRSENDKLDRAATLDVVLGKLFASAANSVISEAGFTERQITGIGSHGQTIRHCPRSEHAYSMQLGSAAHIAEQTGITTVADFRSRDIAAGGEGAPLVPAFHWAAFRSSQANRVIVNIGGIANVTWLPAEGATPVLGFDTGPGNTLLDHWIKRHRGVAYDDEGRWAAKGDVSAELLLALRKDEFFQRPPPKSTDIQHFSPAWLEAGLDELSNPLPPEDVQATLCRLTAHIISEALVMHLRKVEEIYVCGGGAHNKRLMQNLKELVSPIELGSTVRLGIPPDWVEAAAFAWLAFRTLHSQPGNLPSVTGARHKVVLGSIWPGSIVA
ncbi:MAG: anhydro-N-acetylmuramic acid kinase [Gammaproteobacteria bacterium]|nr:anhydro-N-acetylmuramic acid kinase [Gammaproteobacteria bacterium]